MLDSLGHSCRMALKQDKPPIRRLKNGSCSSVQK
ncbi:hypothetical protein 20Sep418_00120 [Pseudomonas phage 20Sep418]|uniref:Uncharacterized protein n=2 Tax=Pakpunavirus TaxID=1921407 RepID=A0AAF0FK03_9CAUD|nr:hypothetical protein QE331_gp041 [Pseudomonas phage 20Sep416]WFG37279.1 hypothetical protein 9081_00178 [Pseudomonas phage bmx-p3]WFG37536.1 hypothetical protein 20Sep416_00041 [Pseudomonas phage 20Sep416]WFG37795.1 hypothetical protein 20Sep418_00120 [Pseudomonas phage 20Sep418]